MYGGFLIMAGIALVALSPLIWVGWWLIADLGERASVRPHPRYEASASRLRPAA